VLRQHDVQFQDLPLIILLKIHRDGILLPSHVLADDFQDFPLLLWQV